MMHSRRRWSILVLIVGCGTRPQQAAPSTALRDLPVESASDSGRPSGVPADYVIAPIGWVHPSCVHGVPSGARIDLNDDVTLNGQLIAHYEQCKYPPVYSPGPFGSKGPTSDGGGPGSTGAIEYAEQNATISDPFDKIYGYMNVPSAPTVNGSTLYYWQGLQSGEFSPPPYGCGILQPVLQWGSSPAGGGNYWGMAAWWWGTSYSGGNDYPNGYYSTLQTGMAVGDALALEMIIYNFSGVPYWLVYMIDTNNESLYTELGVPDECPYDNYLVAFENQGGNLTNCFQMPIETDFYHIQLFTGEPGNIYAANLVSPYAPGSCWPASQHGAAHCNTSTCFFSIASSPPNCHFYINNGNNGGSNSSVGYSNLFQQ
jgi:hypothetical protein